MQNHFWWREATPNCVPVSHTIKNCKIYVSDVMGILPHLASDPALYIARIYPHEFRARFFHDGQFAKTNLCQSTNAKIDKIQPVESDSHSSIADSKLMHYKFAVTIKAH